MLRIEMTILFTCLFVNYSCANRAPNEPPKIDRKDWCIHGTPTRTTGECMCKWSHKDACSGPVCNYEYGLSWHHFTCQDCHCNPKPWIEKANMLRGHMIVKHDVEN